jgi:hypothetical protein
MAVTSNTNNNHVMPENINLEELTKCHHKPKQGSHHHHKAPPAEKNKLQELYQREGNGNTIAHSKL